MDNRGFDDDSRSIISTRSSILSSSSGASSNGESLDRLPSSWGHLIEEDDMDYMKYLYVLTKTQTRILSTHSKTDCVDLGKCYKYTIRGYTVDLCVKKLISDAQSRSLGKVSELRLEKQSKAFAYYVRKSSHISTLIESRTIGMIEKGIAESTVSLVTQNASSEIRDILITPKKIADNKLLETELRTPVLKMLRELQERDIENCKYMSAKIAVPESGLVLVIVFGFESIDLMSAEKCFVSEGCTVKDIYVSPSTCELKIVIESPRAIKKKCSSIINGLMDSVNQLPPLSVSSGQAVSTDNPLLHSQEHLRYRAPSAMSPRPYTPLPPTPYYIHAGRDVNNKEIQSGFNRQIPAPDARNEYANYVPMPPPHSRIQIISRTSAESVISSSSNSPLIRDNRKRTNIQQVDNAHGKKRSRAQYESRESHDRNTHDPWRNIDDNVSNVSGLSPVPSAPDWQSRQLYENPIGSNFSDRFSPINPSLRDAGPTRENQVRYSGEDQNNLKRRRMY